MKLLGRRIWLGVAIVLMTGATAAQARQRVASPSGGAAAACTTADPCDLTTAIEGAANGDEVLIEAGDYGSPSAPLESSIQSTTQGLTVHGPSDGPRPRIFFSVVPTTAGGLSGLDFVNNVTLSNLEVANLSTGAGAQAIYAGPNSSIDHVIASTAGYSQLAGTTAQPEVGAALIANSPVSVTDSLLYATNNGVCTPSCTATQAGAQGLQLQGEGGAATVRYDTIVGADGGSNFAAGVRGLEGTTTTTLQDTIVTGANGLSVSALSASSMTVNADHDVIPNEVTSGPATYNPDQTVSLAPPVFADPLNHNYHEATGSNPTLDAGSPAAGDPSTDLDGNLRNIGPAPDIGAYELPGTPSAAAPAVSGLTAGAATISGLVSTAGGAASVWVEYGTTTSYGSRTAASPVMASTSQESVSFNLTGLTASTRYYAHLVIMNERGMASSSDVTFATSNSGAGGTGGTGGSGGSSVATVPTIAAAGSSVTTAFVTAGVLNVSLPLSVGCPVGETCTVQVTLTASRADAARVKAKPLVIGSVRLRLLGGQQVRPRVRLSPAGAALVRRKRRIRVAYAVKVAGSSGSPVSRTGTLVIRAPRKKRR
jgi:hypothetical protein